MQPAVVAERALHQRVEIVVVRELHVAADIPRESGLVSEARGETADVVVLLDDENAVLAELLQPIRGAEAGGAGADDQMLDEPGNRCHSTTAARKPFIR